MTPRVLGVAGFKNAGKTTLVERLVRELTGRGLRISTVKHAHHSFDVDHPGRDSFRHRMAGASEVCVASRERWALIGELRGEPEPTLEALIARMAPCDLILVEGYKGGSHPKIEVRDLGLDHPPLAEDDPTVVAVAATGPVAGCPVPVYSRDDIGPLADFVCGRFDLGRRPG